MTQIRGSAALVTGAANGIGRELARALVAAECDVALADKDEAGVTSLATELRSRGVRKVTAHSIDVSDWQAMQALAGAVTAAHAGLNIVVNNAGVALFGSDGRVRLYNPVFEKMWQFPFAMLDEHPHIEAVIEQCRKFHRDYETWQSLRADVTTIDRREPILRRIDQGPPR